MSAGYEPQPSFIKDTKDRSRGRFYRENGHTRQAIESRMRKKIDSDNTGESAEHAELDPEHKDVVVRTGNRVIRQCLRVLAMMMVVVIVWGIADVAYVFYERISKPPILLLEITDILATFGAILAVLIAVEIYINVTLYVTSNIIHVKLVIATALMAVARKVIVLDYKVIDVQYVWATAALALALGVAYWLVSREGR